MDMPDKLFVILKNNLSVKDKSLRDFLIKTLDLCQGLGGPAQAVMELEVRRRRFSHDIDFLEKVPYVCLFLAYARFKQPKHYYAIKSARVAIDGLDQLDQVWNSSIARWICALICQQSNRPDDARFFFVDAIKLMKQEIQDLKRRSLYEKAEECEFALDRLLKDAGLLPGNV
jgi:hypothetical protein